MLLSLDVRIVFDIYIDILLTTSKYYKLQTPAATMLFWKISITKLSPPKITKQYS